MFYYILLGIVLGVAGTIILSRRKTYGTVIVFFPDDSAEPPYLGFKINRYSNDICKQKRVEFDVKVEHQHSQK